jgi:hypothetical protein
VQTVCASCRSVVVRHDLDLTAIGEVSHLPPDSSPIQLGTTGRFEGRPFTVVGRIVYNYDEGSWNEWHLLFDDQSSGWLSDAQAEFAVSRRVNPNAIPPAPDAITVGLPYAIGATAYQVTTVTEARYRGVDGDLPFEYWGKEAIMFADLRARGGRFATIDYSETPALLFAGEFVDFDALGFGNLRDLNALTGQAGAVSGFNCSNCGAAIELRAVGHSRTVACTSCGALLDPSDSSLVVLQEAKLRERIHPKVPLGSRGTWHGQPYDVVGFQQRSVEVEGTRYAWDEYVLFNPYRGYRYLTEYEGHWNDVQTVRDLLELEGTSRKRVRHDGQIFRHFQRARARTDFVLGEFPWRVRAGDMVATDDFIAGQEMLSRERTEDEATWSRGRYTPGAAIWQAFAVAGAPPSPVGVFANQPNPYLARRGTATRWFLVLAALLAIVFLARVVTADRERVFEQLYTFTPSGPPQSVEQAFVTDPFRLSQPSSVEVNVTADVSNAWLGLDLALIDTESGTAYNVAPEVEYYAGVDSDGPWTEGNRQGRLVLPRLAAGEYYLRVDPESNATVPVHYTIRLRRDVPTLLPYGIALGLLVLPVIWTWNRSLAFEHARMQESDVGSGSDEED